MTSASTPSARPLSIPTDAAPPVGRVRHVLVLGGSLDHLGGVEAFCDRAQEVLARRGTWHVDRIATSSAYLTPTKLPRFAAGLATLIRRRRPKPDLVWLQYVNLPDLAYALVARALGLKVMVTPHLGSNWRSQTNPLLRRLSGRILAQVQRFALISPTQELEILLPPGVPRSAIRNFLPAEILGAPPPVRDTRPAPMQLIHSGRLSEGKGTFLLVEMCARLRDRGVPFAARITGAADAATMTRLHAAIAEHGLQGQVAVLGRVPEEELLAHLRASDVLVHLSRIDSYPLIVLEAMACGATVVCMELAGARDMVDSYGGAVVSQADPVGEGVDWLASRDVAELRRLGERASAHVRRDYDWDRCATAVEAALAACLDDPDDVRR